MGMVKAVTELAQERCEPGEIAERLGVSVRAVCGVLGKGNGYRADVIRLWGEGTMPEAIAGKLGLDVEAVEMIVENPANYGRGLRE